MTIPPNRLEAAYAHHLPALLAIAPREAATPRVDLTAVSAALLAALPRLETTLPRLQTLPDIPWPIVSELPTRAMALVQAHGRHLAAESPEPCLDVALEHARALRTELIKAGIALGGVNGISQAALAKIRKGRGRKDIGVALIALAGLFHEAWHMINGRTAITLAQLDEAARLGDELLTALGEREAALGRVAEATLMRNRAFALFLAAEKPARRGLVFLVGEAEAREVLPVVFDWRRFGGRRAKAAAAENVPAHQNKDEADTSGENPGSERADNTRP